MRWGAAAAILLLAAFLRLGHLDDAGFTAAELRAVRLANASSDRVFSDLRAQGGATPAPYAILRFAILYGLREEPLRMPEAIAGILAVAAAMLLVRDLFGARAALVSGLLLAVSPLHIEVSRQAGAVGISMAASLALSWFLLRLLRGERVLWRSALAGAVALYCGYAALAVLAAAMLTALWALLRGHLQRAAAGRVFAAAVAALALFAPWGVYDLPTEPGAQFLVQTSSAAVLRQILSAPFTGSAQSGALAGDIVGFGAALLAATGAVLAWRRRPLATGFAIAVLSVAVAASVATARAGPYLLSPPQLLFVLPLFLGLGAVALERAVRVLPWRGLWTPVCLVVAAAFVWAVERPALAERSRDAEDWRGAFAILERNLGRDDLVGAPMASDAVQVYGLELARRLPAKDRLSMTYAWLAREDHGWLVAGAPARFSPESPKFFSQLSALRFMVDLSPSDEPALYFLGGERRQTYILACHFDLPPRVLARQTIVRDCLRELGAMEGPLRQVRALLADPEIPLRNPSLLESVTLLVGLGKVDEARALAQAIATREPDWPEARAALAGLPASTPSPTP